MSAILLFSNLNIGGLSGYDDALFAHESKEMLRTGDWLNPSVNGSPHFEYPPLILWMQAVSMSVIGVSDLAVKFPSALSGWLLILLTFFVARSLTGSEIVSVIAAWVLMLTQYFMKYATHAMSDVPFALLFTLALFFYLKGIDRRSMLVLCGACIGAAVLTRSILGIIPLGIILAHILLTRRFAILLTKEAAFGLVTAIALPSIWYGLSFAAHGAAFAEGHFSFLWAKMAERFEVQQFLSKLLTYPIFLLKSYQPWLLFAVVGFIGQFRKAYSTREPAAVFLVLWILLLLIPFCLASAQVLRYIMPIFPAAAILAALPLATWLPKLIKPRYRIATFGVLCIITAMIAAFPNPRFRAENVLEISPAIVASTKPQERVVLFTSGDVQTEIRNQLLWYTDRYYDHLFDVNELRLKLGAGKGLAFVVDRATFDTNALELNNSISSVSKTEHFVFFRTIEQP